MGDPCVELTILPPTRVDRLEILKPQTPAALRTCRDALYLNLYIT
jgi:hypothetical protein